MRHFHFLLNEENNIIYIVMVVLVKTGSNKQIIYILLFYNTHLLFHNI